MKKRIFLDSIQQQIIRQHENKNVVRQNKIKEDLDYLNGLKNNYPFGRGGAGAPNRDKDGNILTNQTRLISDPKYQHYNIVVNDDYHTRLKKLIIFLLF